MHTATVGRRMWSAHRLCLAALALLAACARGVPSAPADPGEPPAAPDSGQPLPIPEVAVAISPLEKTLAPGASQQFSPAVTGSVDLAVSWSVDEIGGGSIDG